MANIFTSDVSDGEIVEDLSEISSDEGNYFENLKKNLETLASRKVELELENSFAGQFGKSFLLRKNKKFTH